MNCKFVGFLYVHRYTLMHVRIEVYEYRCILHMYNMCMNMYDNLGTHVRMYRHRMYVCTYACMQVCMQVSIRACMHVYLQVYVNSCVSVFVSVATCMYLHVCMHTCMSIWHILAYTYIQMCKRCKYAHKHIYLYRYTHTHMHKCMQIHHTYIHAYILDRYLHA